MTYNEALEYIHSVTWLGSRPGLSRITELCHLIGDPQNKLSFVHVAGTNGKGSTTSMLSSILSEAGYKVGNIDATVIAQAPKLAPHIEKMRQNIAKATDTDISDISVKATTEEKLGFTGDGSGISAHAVCLIENL